MAKRTTKKLTFAALHKWTIKINEDGTTWKANYSNALARGNDGQKVAKKWKKIITPTRYFSLYEISAGRYTPVYIEE